MIEIKSSGNWPLNSINDINTARSKLQHQGRVGVPVHLVGSPHRIKELDTQIPDTDMTFRGFFLNNKFVEDIIETRSLKNPDDVFLVWYNVSFTGDLEPEVETTIVRIADIVYQLPPPPRTLTNAELLKRLKEAPTRAVIREATLRMFQSLSESANNEV